MTKSRLSATRSHDFCAGHRVFGHEGKCRYLHGHGYRVHFECEAASLDDVGRVIDFSEIKTRLCDWVEENWDHRTLIWEGDPLARTLMGVAGVAFVPFNPTAENIANHLLHVVGPERLRDTHVRLIRVRVEETPKCSAEARC